LTTMVEEVVCPACGRGTEKGMAEAYRVCVHCGGDLGPALTGGSPMNDLQRSIDGGTPPTTHPGGGYPPPSQQPLGPQPYPQAPYGQPAYPQPQPSYGQPPPAYGAQPYGGQPYPPPGFAPGPGYGYPPPGMYLPTFHPGLYERPAREPYIDVGNLFRLLFHPKEAFEDLYDHTSTAQGFILAAIFIVLSTVASLVANLVFLGSVDLPEEGAVPMFSDGNAAVSVVGIFTGIFFFWLTAWMFNAIVKSKARAPSLEKTIGLMGYAKFPAFIVMTLISILIPITLIGVVDSAEQPDEFVGAICGTLAVVFGLGIIGVIWSWWVHSHAQSVANDVSTGTAFGYLLLTWILIGIIESVIGLVIAFAILGTTLGV
jgi:hypothetical protein